jgi:hypothetical protein
MEEAVKKLWKLWYLAIRPVLVALGVIALAAGILFACRLVGTRAPFVLPAAFAVVGLWCFGAMVIAIFDRPRPPRPRS